MSFDHGILNLTNWVGNVMMPTMAAVFVILGILQFSKGRDSSHSLYGVFGCLCVSGLTRAIETFAAQRAFDDPDRFWMSIVTLIDWFGNVILPLYAGAHVALGAMRLAVHSQINPTAGWLRHFTTAALCMLVSGLLRLVEFFVTNGTAGVR
ncbi:MAG TPA: hypothetical protein VKZ53_22570 [Candidatus Angelobacter sp.]|nr:hypothetical protein [Candidatus Angelobacter sp.]